MPTYERGDVVEASDPFTDTKPSRPFLIANTAAHPFHGEQYVAITLTTKTWYDETIPLSTDDFREGGVPEESAIGTSAVFLLLSGLNYFADAGSFALPISERLSAILQLLGG